jgi:hypothetical protein
MNLSRQYAQTHGLAKLNTLTKYPSILTLHKLGERGVLTDELTTPGVQDTPLFGTEKIHGTNARVLIFRDGSYLIGDRESFLHNSGDLIHNPNNGVVDTIHQVLARRYHAQTDDLTLIGYCYTQNSTGALAPLTVLYGEVYGGRINDHKQYGTDCPGFRVFDVAVYDSQSLHELLTLESVKLSNWREHENQDGSLRYGQPFLGREALQLFADTHTVELVPELPLAGLPLDLSPEGVLHYLQQVIPTSQATLSDTAKGKPEGVVLASANRKIRVKVRYEDYERTIKALARKA